MFFGFGVCLLQLQALLAQHATVASSCVVEATRLAMRVDGATSGGVARRPAPTGAGGGGPAGAVAVAVAVVEVVVR